MIGLVSIYDIDIETFGENDLKNPCILGNSRAVNTRFCSFTFKHSGVITKFDVVMSNVHSSKCNFVTSKLSYFCPWSSIFETFAGNVPFRAIIGTGKKNFSKHFLQNFRVTKCFYAVRTIKHGFLIHLHLLDPSGGVETLACSRLVFQQLLRGPADVNA